MVESEAGKKDELMDNSLVVQMELRTGNATALQMVDEKDDLQVDEMAAQ
jgi:hypothetical protein